jgi:hypothetical protein
MLQLSCEKSYQDIAGDPIAGKWKMIVVKDNATTLSTTRPASTPGDVILTITVLNASTYSLTGNTPTNEISEGYFMVAPERKMIFGALSMTKVAETVWGSLFVDHIRDAQQYNFPARGRLDIQTSLKMLSFVKL